MAKGKIIGIVHTHANRVLRHATALYCHLFRREDYEATLIDLSDQDALQRLGAALNGGKVDFAFGLQGVGSRLEANDGENLWLAARTPFLSLHYDHPCYNPVNHINDSPYVANFYFFPSFLETKQRYLPSAQINGLLPFELMVVPERPKLFFPQKPIKLLFMKTGASLDEPLRQLNSLIPPLRDAIFDRLALTVKDPNLQICDLVQDIFDGHGLVREDHHQLFWGIAQMMDIYIRRKRAIDFVNWIKLQKGAIIVGDGWDFIDRDGVQAEFRPAMPTEQAFALYGQTQFVCNTNPYGRDIIHERILHGMLMWCNVITDSNAWLDHDMASFPAIRRFDWNQDLDTQIQPVLANKAAAVQAVHTSRRDTYEKFQRRHMIGMVLQAGHEIAATLQELAESQKERASAQ